MTNEILFKYKKIKIFDLLRQLLFVAVKVIIFHAPKRDEQFQTTNKGTRQ